jgi:hypothetical protein
MTIVPIEENYHLCEILKKTGYQIVKSKLFLEEKEGTFEITAKSLLKDKNRLESLENLLTLPSILDYYKNNDPDDIL